MTGSVRARTQEVIKWRTIVSIPLKVLFCFTSSPYYLHPRPKADFVGNQSSLKIEISYRIHQDLSIFHEVISFDNYDASWCIPDCLRYFCWNFHITQDSIRHGSTASTATHATSFAPYRAAVPRSDRSSLPGMMSNIYRKPWCLPAVWILKHMKPDETGHFWKVT